MSKSTNTGELTTCVIGGAGFIGRYVVQELLRWGRQVLVVGRSQLMSPLPAGVQYVQNTPTLSGETGLRQALAAADEVIDLAYATVPQTSFQDPINDIVTNLPEAVRLFELAASLPIRKFIWVSSGGTVYGRTAAQPLTEDHATLPLSPYGITKLTIEKYAHMYFESRGLPISCVRPSNAFGEGQLPYRGQGFIATAIASILDKRPITLFGEHGTIRDYLHVADIASGIVYALLFGAAGEIYNIGSGVGLTNWQVLEQLAPLAAGTGRTIDLHQLPPRPFDVPANILDSTKLQTATNWAPASFFADALARTWYWYASRQAGTHWS